MQRALVGGLIEIDDVEFGERVDGAGAAVQVPLGTGGRRTTTTAAYRDPWRRRPVNLLAHDVLCGAVGAERMGVRGRMSWSCGVT
jgi:hypothetical protein